jgi:hypothetical protein
MRINEIMRLIFLIAISMLSTACSSIKYVTINNNSAESIDFQGGFITTTGEVDNLDFQLKPGDSNSWRYEISSFESDELDKGLNKITLSVSSECSITLDRNEIEEIAEKDGMWFITIDSAIVNCK